MSENMLNVENLVIHYETEEEVVEAVNNISFRLKKEKFSDWWRPAQEKQRLRWGLWDCCRQGWTCDPRQD